MFSWKRQRKEEPEAEAALRGAAAGGPSSAAHDPCGDCAEPDTPTAAVPGPSSLCPAPSIELASMDCAASSSAVAAAAACRGPALALERASVRTKAAFFEALISVQRTTDSTAAHQQQPSYPAAAAGDDAAAALVACSSRGSDVVSGNNATSACSGASSSGGGGGGGAGGQGEVCIQLRLPHPPAPPPRAAGGRYGSVAEMEALIEALQAQLAVSERQRQAAVDACARRVRHRAAGLGGGGSGCSRSALLVSACQPASQARPSLP